MQSWARKLGMTQIFEDGGRVTPVTVIAAGPCVVTQLKTIAKDGYSAAQFGFEDIKEHRLTSPLSRATSPPHGVQAEARTCAKSRWTRARPWPKATEFKADIFAVGDKVAVTGISKGKGFAGVVKRYRWHGHNATHGASTSHRKPQSGGATDAARTFKGSGKPGHMGAAPGDPAGPASRHASTPTRTCCSSGARSPARTAALS